MSDEKVWAIIPAAGIGVRMESNTPKQYLQLDTRTVLDVTLSKILALSFVAGVIVAIHPDDTFWVNLPIAQHEKVHSVIGGDTRQASVMSAMRFLDGLDLGDHWLFVHDAARPCIALEKIEELYHVAIRENCGAILASPVSDTVKKSSDGTHVSSTENRQVLWLAHTPQMFRASVLNEAFIFAQQNDVQFTDEASAVEALGKKVRLVSDLSSNIKITVPTDLALAHCILKQQNWS